MLNLSTFKKPLQVRWSRAASGFYVENLFTVECEVILCFFFHLVFVYCLLNLKINFQEFDDLLAVLEEGMRNRAVGSHK